MIVKILGKSYFELKPAKFDFALFTFSFIWFLGIVGQFFHVRLYLCMTKRNSRLEWKAPKSTLKSVFKIKLVNVTLSLYVLPSSCTDLRSTAPFRPFLPSFARRLRKHLLMQNPQNPSMSKHTTARKKFKIY